MVGFVHEGSGGENQKVLRLLVNFATMCDPRYAYELSVVIDDIQYAPVTHPDAPLIFVAL